MKKLNKFIKAFAVCLIAIMSVAANMNTVAYAAEVEGSTVAIIEIEDYSIEGGMISAGKEITVNMKLHNASSSMSASSIMMTLTNSTGTVYPSYGKSNQIYVGTIGADETKEVSIPMTIGSAFAGDAIDLSCQFNYLAQNTQLSNTAMIMIPTSGGSTIGIKSIDVSSHAIVNGKSLLSFSYVNQSSSNITDAKLIIDGKNISSKSKEIKIDTVYAGKSYTKDFYVIFDKAGNQSIDVSLEYTDIDGEKNVTDLGKFDVTVSKENSEKISSSNVNRILGLVGKGVSFVVGLFALSVIYIYIKKR